ncbi:MAG TPA: alpha/beta hydrolase [Xanthobacteraceae bacterium]|nr:alpha/beta hydrolase [Xanthobacteraceae bacterium]
MLGSTFTLETPDGVSLFIYRWLPDVPPKAVIQIAHGLAEHAGRYARLAEALSNRGYAVYANDLRGHGRTAKTTADLGFFAEHDGWNKCVGDLWWLNRQIAARHSGLPIVLFGHSMGSFLAQQLITDHGEAFAGAVLSGSNGKPPVLAIIARLLARLERLRAGSRGRSALMHTVLFAAFNRPFRPARTPFDWLSRDPAEVDKYVADPLCGFGSTAQLYSDLLGALGEIAAPARQARIPKRLPIYIFNGSRDPVATNIGQLLAAYQAVGLEKVTYRTYRDGRHESLNEINRDEVTRDLLTWLDVVTSN